MFIELPQENHDWLRENLPVLAYCGTSIAPPTDFVIDADVRRVSVSYSWALADGEAFIPPATHQHRSLFCHRFVLIFEHTVTRRTLISFPIDA